MGKSPAQSAGGVNGPKEKARLGFGFPDGQDAERVIVCLAAEKPEFDRGRCNMRVEIIPLESVVVQGTPFCFGMRQSAVERAIGKG